ncbi:DUF655 domain-containing protein [Halobaculum sp. CBA1158]|uniref:DUF655 domain-containing protein n=1 Tax=Halobaculum sp. CBA1158 TaxID=2904243 RepID=UPI001F3BCE2F|nr:DUF655 domain-containing protein [Halobaculum sp. CBA1158]UIO98577.1 DUF655 domain-containing protein [Halobaculum sp. CBA1158]
MTHAHDGGPDGEPPDGDAVTDGGEVDDDPAAADADAGGDAADAGEDEDAVHAIVLEFLPHGRADDDRPQHRRTPVAYALGDRDFRLFEFQLSEDAEFGIGDRVRVDPDTASGIERVRDVGYDDLNRGARQELEYVVSEVIAADERRFVDFFNDAEPISLRLHQLNLLPGIGKKLRNNVLDARKRGPFESFEDLSERVSGLHDPQETLAERVLEELRDDDLKYRIFVGVDAPTANKG